jgi:hypothetical protein
MNHTNCQTTTATASNYVVISGMGAGTTLGSYRFYPAPNSVPYVPPNPNTSHIPNSFFSLQCVACDETLEFGDKTICKKCKKVIKAMRAIVVDGEEE